MTSLHAISKFSQPGGKQVKIRLFDFSILPQSAVSTMSIYVNHLCVIRMRHLKETSKMVKQI